LNFNQNWQKRLQAKYYYCLKVVYFKLQNIGSALRVKNRRPKSTVAGELLKY